MHKLSTEPEKQAEQALAALAYLRIWHIIGCKKRGIEGLLPIGRSTFLAKVRSGEYPQPVKLGEKTSAWRKSDIIELLKSFGGAA
ncbi:AlpA family transcriptional regulator [Methylobacter sp. BBA5.1]|uniref:helix-turn-helix transcriptional regulator n=1 Tax=Methylobacter sp. BBA5.1 TaxID=1495064 RepID=UPI00068D196D|nr:AlpA family phage regulatory protein [Methylobacter sp. BBA5.1]